MSSTNSILFTCQGDFNCNAFVNNDSNTSISSYFHFLEISIPYYLKLFNSNSWITFSCYYILTHSIWERAVSGDLWCRRSQCCGFAGQIGGIHITLSWKSWNMANAANHHFPSGGNNCFCCLVVKRLTIRIWLIFIARRCHRILLQLRPFCLSTIWWWMQGFSESLIQI